MQVSNLSKHLICEKPLFLHNLDVLIKMFANSLAVLSQQTLGRADHVHCFQAQLTESCLVFGSAQIRDSSVIVYFFKKQPVHPVYADSGLMISGIDLKFTFYSKIFLSLQQVHVSVYASTNDYLRCTKCEVHERVRKHDIRCTKKRVPRFLILEARICLVNVIIVLIIWKV